MAFKTKINLNAFNNLSKKIKQINSNRIKNQIGSTTVREMKQFISKGISPIRGKGRFPGYKKSYLQQIRGNLAFFTRSDGKVVGFKPKRRSQKFSNKKERPVNLTLTGQMLKSLKHSLTGKGVRIGYSGKEASDKELGHRKGTNKQRKRPTIPNPPREKFALTIQNKIIALINKRLNKLFQ